MSDARSGDGATGDLPLTSDRHDEALNHVWRVLNRDAEIDALRELYNGLDAGRRPSLSDEARIAFGFDTSGIFRVGMNGTAGDNALDYLRQQYTGPLLLPGQAIQELWNNAMAGVEPRAKRVQKQFDALEKEMGNLDQQLGPPGEVVREAIESLVRAHAEWFDPESLSILDRTIETLLSVGHVSYVPRREFLPLARVRNDSKTPPGFRDDDDNHGDFFVWADFLYALSKADKEHVDAVVLVTNEKKPDWSRLGVPHPILVAEAVAVGGVPFRLWSVSEFQAHVKRLLA